MKNRMFITLLTLVSFVSQTAFAVSLGEDQVTIGKKGSTANKVLNLGVGSLRYNQSTGQLEFSNDGTNFSGVGSGSGSGSGYNIITTNPDFESSTAAYTSSGGTFAAVSSGSNLLFGKGSVTFQASATGQYFESASYTIPNGLLGKACQVGIWQQGGDANLQLQAIDGTGAVVPNSTITLAAQTNPMPVVQTFRCPSSGTIKLRVSSTAASALAAFDRAYVGEQSTYQVQQAQLVGTLVLGAFGGAPNTSSTGSWLDFPAQSGSTVTVTGSVANPGSAIPVASISGAQPGAYEVTATATMQSACSGTNDGGQIVRIIEANSGTVVAQVKAATESTSGAANMLPITLSGIYPQTSTGNLSFKIQGFRATNCTTWALRFNEVGPQMTIKYLPTVSQTAYRADQTPASWSGTSTQSATTASATSGALSTSLSGSVTAVGTPRNINCSTAAGTIGITCGLPRLGNYLVCHSGYASNLTSGAGAGSQLVDGSGTVIVGAQFGQSSSASYPFGYGGCGVYTATSLTTTFQVYGNTNSGGTASFNQRSYSVVELDAPMAMPFVLNQVNTDNSNGVKQFFGAFGGASSVTACTTSPCTIYNASNSGNVSVTRTGTGRYSMNASGVGCNGNIVCTYSVGSSLDALIYSYTSSTPTTFVFGVDNYNGVAMDAAVEYQCSCTK